MLTSIHWLARLLAPRRAIPDWLVTLCNIERVSVSGVPSAPCFQMLLQEIRRLSLGGWSRPALDAICAKTP